MDARTKILETATRLFATHGYDSTSLAHVAKDAHVSKALIFWHFESKEALERHMKTKQYKRDKKRVLNGPAPHEQRDAEAAAGMGAPDNGKKRTHRSAKDVDMQ